MKDFKYNLLSISRLLEDSDLVALFTQKGFMVQDPTTRKIVADGNKVSGLYKLKAANCQYKPMVSNVFFTYQRRVSKGYEL